MFRRWSQPLHAHPATYRAGEDGFEIAYPSRAAIDVEGHRKDIAYPHQAALILSPSDFQAEDARLAAQGDFSVTVRLGNAAGDELLATILHGSPFSYYTLSRGNLRLALRAAPSPVQRQSRPTSFASAPSAGISSYSHPRMPSGAKVRAVGN